jgi:hypothetical protein
MADSYDVLGSWLQVIVQTTGVLVTIVFAILAVLWGSTVLPVRPLARAAASAPLLAASLTFLVAIWKGLDGLGTLALALTNPWATPTGVMAKVQPPALDADRAFKLGIILVVLASITITILSIIGS